MPTRAYILEEQEPLTNYKNEPAKNTTVRWTYSEDAQEIINAPINDVIFVDENDDKHHKNTRQKILNRCNIDPLILKHQQIFKIFLIDYPLKQFHIETKPRLELHKGYDEELNAKVFSEYIRDIDNSISYKGMFHYAVSNNEKDRYNNAGIYVRPIKKIFEYNPVMAKRQYDLRHSKKEIPAYSFMQRNDLQSFQSELQRMFRRNLEVQIIYRDGWQSGHTKRGISSSIVVLIDFYNLFFQKNSYRNLNSYKNLIKKWKTTSQQKREEYPKKFFQWVNTEEKIKLKPKQEQEYWTKKKPKLKIFKTSKLKWTKQ